MSESNLDPPPGPSTDLEVPAEIRRMTSGTSSSLGCVVAGIALAFPVILYFGSFGLLMIDALILETNYFSPRNVSPEILEAARVIYAPLTYLVNLSMNP
jgi:hypothetical protein